MSTHRFRSRPCRAPGARGAPRKAIACATVGVIAALAIAGTSELTIASAQTGGQTSAEPSLLERVRENLRRERKLLVEYSYRERRRPMRVSRLGKVYVGEEQLFDVTPTADPDRPHRTLVEVGGRPATKEEREAFARRQGRDDASPEQRRERERRDLEASRKAQERFEDAFRVYRFDELDTAVVDGYPCRRFAVIPQPDVPTRSDLGKWMKKFQGTACVTEDSAELVHLEMVATDTITVGWGIVGRLTKGTTVTYERRLAHGLWLPARARIQARGRTLLLRSFDVDSLTEWFDYRPYRATDATRN